MKTLRIYYPEHGIIAYESPAGSTIHTIRRKDWHIDKPSAYYLANGDSIKIKRLEAAKIIKDWRKKDCKRVANGQARPIDRAAYLVRDIMAHQTTQI